RWRSGSRSPGSPLRTCDRVPCGGWPCVSVSKIGDGEYTRSARTKQGATGSERIKNREGADGRRLSVARGKLEGAAFGDVRVGELITDPDEVLLAVDEGLDDLGVEVLPGLGQDHVARLVVREGHLVGALRREGVVDVGQRDDAGAEGDLLSAQRAVLAVDLDRRIAAAVPLLVVEAGDHLADREDRLAVDHLAGHAEGAGADLRVVLHLLELFGRELVGLLEDVVADADLAQ